MRTRAARTTSIAAYPSKTFFLEQPAPKAVFTVSAGVRHVLRMPNLPRGVPLVRVEDAGMARADGALRADRGDALRAAARHVSRAAARSGSGGSTAARAPAQIAAGVMGLGVIGSAIARALAAQGFAVRGYARSARVDRRRPLLRGREALGALPRRASTSSSACCRRPRRRRACSIARR